MKDLVIPFGFEDQVSIYDTPDDPGFFRIDCATAELDVDDAKQLITWMTEWLEEQTK